MIDLHCDTLYECIVKDGYVLSKNSGHIDIEKMKKGGVVAQCFAIYVPTHQNAMDAGITLDPYAYYHKGVEMFKREIGANADIIAPARSVEDILKNRAEGKMSAILTVEDAVPLSGDIRRVDEFSSDGVRMVSLTWNHENSVGFPNSADPEKMALGLKEFGIQCIERMDELGIAADVSHLSEGGFWDVVKYGKKPFVASHSCARALCDHPRNLTDAQLKAIADRGGVVGVNFFARFLKKSDENHTDNADIVRHLDYIRNVAGIESLALGSDFDGIDSTLEMKDCSGFPGLADAMSRCFTADEIDRICVGNALRMFRDVIGK